MEANSDSANISSNPSNNKEESTENFVNHAELAWQELKKKWVGDPAKRISDLPLEPVIGFNVTYEDLLLSNTLFQRPIPLAEMVDFLVDFWQEDGLFD